MNCTSDLCGLYPPCGKCGKVGVTTHEDSALCVEMQMDQIGCHACGRAGCWCSSLACHSRCTRRSHVCGPSQRESGCTSCGRVCHENNRDLRCEYFQHERGVLPWPANDQQLLDASQGTQGAVPHMSGQVTWECTARRTPLGQVQVLVNGIYYYVGYGDPGRAAKGEFNNCLIDSLRQCLGVEVDRREVRQDLLISS